MIIIWLVKPNYFSLIEKLNLLLIEIILEKVVKTKILQGLLVFSILFLIYISGIFDMVITTLPNTILLLFIDDLRFLVNRKSIYKMATNLKKIRKMVLK